MHLFSYKRLLISTLTFFSLAHSLVFAKPINFYDQPKADSKLLGTVDSEIGIIPIFTPNTGDWIKIADPRNGDVGWVKAQELGNIKMNFHLITQKNGAQSYQMIQYSGDPSSSEQITKNFEQLEKQHQAIQKDMQRMMQDLSQDMPVFKTFPVMMPVVIVPHQENKAAKTSEKK